MIHCVKVYEPIDSDFCPLGSCERDLDDDGQVLLAIPLPNGFYRFDRFRFRDCGPAVVYVPA